jgi:hypothetical protein
METKYVGRRTPEEGCQVEKVTDAGAEPLDLRFDLRRHSPSGAEWGYGGSGPAQLALAIICDVTQDDRLSSRYYQQFKREVVARLPKDGFSLTAEEIRAWIVEKTKGELLDPKEEFDEEEDLAGGDEEALEAPRAPSVRSERTRELPLGIKGDRAFVRKLLAVGQEFDLNKGGHYDSRSGVVNLWCSPEDKPAGWDRPITKGGLSYPRELVGALTWSWTGDDEVTLAIDVSPYALLPESARHQYQWKKIPEELWDSCVEWLKLKAHELVRFACIHADYLGAGCPWCEHTTAAGELLTGLIEHVAKEHGPVASLTLGEGVILTLQDGRSARIRDVSDVEH